METWKRASRTRHQELPTISPHYRCVFRLIEEALMRINNMAVQKLHRNR
jgi:hypothetical protein